MPQRPQLTYEDLQAQAQAQLGISRAQIGGVLTSLAAGRKRLPREVDYPITRDAQHRRYRIEPVAAELLLAAVERARGIAPPRGWSPGRVQWFGLMVAVAGREVGTPVGNPVVVTVTAGMAAGGRQT